MQCGRCGAPYEGNFCPECGAPATALVSGPAPEFPGWRCPRCGTMYRGNFCPSCGLSASAAYAVLLSRPISSPGRSALSVIWTVSMVALFILVAMNLAGLVLGVGFVVPGISNLQRGSTANADLTSGANPWAFTPVDPAATGAWNPSGYLEMSSPTAPGPVPFGFWWQRFEVSGSTPFVARVQLDVRVDLGSTSTLGTLLVFVEEFPVLPVAPLRSAVGEVNFTTSVDWMTTDRFLVEPEFSGPGPYYLLLAFFTAASGPGSPTVAAFDDVVLMWTTDAAVVLYVALPDFIPFFVSQNQTLFLAYYGFLVGIILFSTVYHAIRERRAAADAFLAPLASIGSRLRNRSAWLTVGQVWMAMTFFQVTIILILDALGALPDAPFDVTSENLWVALYELAHVSVYEELLFRLVLIGVPMAVGSFVLRIIEVNRTGGRSRGPGAARKHVLGSARYLAGGTVRKTSSKETILAAWVLLVFSSLLFGFAHLGGWGWWKVLPSAVAGLGFGYLFLRHGVTAAILAHFVNDYAASLLYMGVGGDALAVFSELLFLGLTAVGAGFFIWYARYALGHLRGLIARLSGAPPSVPVESGAMPRAAHGPSSLAGNPTPTWSPSPASETPGFVRDPTSVPGGYSPSYRAPPYGYPPVRFQCPSCRWVEARYEGGRFTCVRCGRMA